MLLRRACEDTDFLRCICVWLRPVCGSVSPHRWRAFSRPILLRICGSRGTNIGCIRAYVGSATRRKKFSRGRFNDRGGPNAPLGLRPRSRVLPSFPPGLITPEPQNADPAFSSATSGADRYSAIPAVLPGGRLLDEAQRPDLFPDCDDLSTQFLKSMNSATSCFALRSAAGNKGFRGGIAWHPPRQSEIGTIAGVAAFGAVAVGFATLAGSRGDEPAPKITDARKLAEQIALLGFPTGAKSRSISPPFVC